MTYHIRLGGAPVPAVDREEKNVINNLNDQIAKLQEQNSVLNSKVQQLSASLEKKKKEIAELNRSLNNYKRSTSAKDKSSTGTKEINIVQAPTIKPQSTQKPPPAIDEAQLNDSSLLEVARKYKAR